MLLVGMLCSCVNIWLNIISYRRGWMVWVSSLVGLWCNLCMFMLVMVFILVRYRDVCCNMKVIVIFR